MKQIFTKENILICEVKFTKDFFSNYSKHFHDKLNINIIEEGEVQIEFKDSRFEILKANQFSIFRPFEIHKTTKLTENTKGYHVLYFSNEWLKNFLPIQLNKNVIEDETICKTFLTISKKILNDQIIKEEELSSLFDKLKSIHILKEQDTYKENTLIDEIKKYLIKNSDYTPSLENLSINFGLSKEHIIRIFKKELGLTPHAFITSYKINQAKNLISAENNKSICDIASESGFYDQSHFSKSFKKVFAINPSEVLDK